MPQKIEFHKVRGIAEIINTTFEFTRENMKNLFKAVVFIAGPFILAGSVLYGYIMYSIFNLGLQSTTGIGPVNPFLSFGIEFTFFLIIILVAGFLFYSVVYEYINIYVNQNLTSIEISDVWQAIKKDFWLLVRTNLGLILLFIALMLLFMVVSFIVMAIGGAIGAITSPVVMFIFIIPLYVFLFYILIPYCLIFNVRINERKRFFDSISQCNNLIAGNRLRTMGVVILSLILQFMLSFVLNIPNYIIQYLNTHSSYDIDLGWLNFANAGIILIASFVIGTLSIISINLQYFNLLERKQAVSLLNKIDGLGSVPKTPLANEETY